LGATITGSIEGDGVEGAAGIGRNCNGEADMVIAAQVQPGNTGLGVAANCGIGRIQKRSSAREDALWPGSEEAGRGR